MKPDKTARTGTPTRSDTGYIHLTMEELCGVALVHLLSGVDPQDGACCADAVATTITGYTEWVSVGEAALTIGWDWQMRTDGDTVRLQRLGAPSSNLMLQSCARRDLGHQATVVLLQEYLDRFNWQVATLACIDARYGA